MNRPYSNDAETETQETGQHDRGSRRDPRRAERFSGVGEGSSHARIESQVLCVGNPWRALHALLWLLFVA